MIQSSMKSNRSSRDIFGGRRRPSNLSVGFDERTSVYLAKSHRDYNDAEFEQIYRIEIDEQRAKKDMVRCITVLRSGSEEQRRADDYCPRGLEKMQSAESILRSKVAKERVIDAVLDEQDRQWEDNHIDTDLLADISAGYSANAVEIAILRAESDAAFARLYNPPPRNNNEKGAESSRCGPMSLPSTSDSSTLVDFYPQQRSAVLNTLNKVLSSPDLTSIGTNVATMAKARSRHASHNSSTTSNRMVPRGRKTHNTPGA